MKTKPAIHREVKDEDLVLIGTFSINGIQFQNEDGSWRIDNYRRLEKDAPVNLIPDNNIHDRNSLLISSTEGDLGYIPKNQTYKIRRHADRFIVAHLYGDRRIKVFYDKSVQAVFTKGKSTNWFPYIVWGLFLVSLFYSIKVAFFIGIFGLILKFAPGLFFESHSEYEIVDSHRSISTHSDRIKEDISSLPYTETFKVEIVSSEETLRVGDEPSLWNMPDTEKINVYTPGSSAGRGLIGSFNSEYLAFHLSEGNDIFVETEVLKVSGDYFHLFVNIDKVVEGFEDLYKEV